MGSDPSPARRRAWLAARREDVRAQYDAEAATYDADPYPATLHGDFVDRLVARVPLGGRILDAPCGTGRYFARVVGAGRRVVGIDQSAGMLAEAAKLELADELIRVGLQELDLRRAYDGAMTIDAMENVPPEDWPIVVGNIRRALQPGAPWYLTLEETDDATIDDAHRRLATDELPVVRGEVIEGDVAGYHFYPGRDRALAWLADGGFTILEEAYEQQAGWGYRHFLLGS